MTLKEFRKLKHRDFTNGAVLDEIEKVIESRDDLLAACKAILDTLYKHGEFDDGAFYYAGRAASEFEPPLVTMKAAYDKAIS